MYKEKDDKSLYQTVFLKPFKILWHKGIYKHKTPLQYICCRCLQCKCRYQAELIKPDFKALICQENMSLTVNFLTVVSLLFSFSSLLRNTSLLFPIILSGLMHLRNSSRTPTVCMAIEPQRWRIHKPRRGGKHSIYLSWEGFTDGQRATDFPKMPVWSLSSYTSSWPSLPTHP